MSNKDKIIQLTKQLYPTGRAFRIPDNGVLDKTHKALAESEKDTFNDAVSILDSALPDNDNFTELDATLWEERLGMITNPLVSLSDRKKAIIRKMNHPGSIPARQSHDYLQNSLQLAGFNVFVHENIPTLSPADIIGPELTGIAEHSEDVEHMETGMEHGDTETGSVFYNVVANNIDEEKDTYFNVGDNLRSTFYIGGEVLGDFANVPEIRKKEFRQLILRIKPVQSIAFLFINYV